MKVQIGRTSVELVMGDITEQKVDAVVNAANNMLWMGSGVAGAIKSKGGKEIEDEAVTEAPIDVGEVVTTGAGKLDAKYVIHGAVMGQDLKTDGEKIRKVTRRSLKEAANLKINSVALPAFGTGVGGFHARDCAKIMIDEIMNYLLETDSELNTVKLVLFEEGIYNIFKQELQARFKRG